MRVNTTPQICACDSYMTPPKSGFICHCSEEIPRITILKYKDFGSQHQHDIATLTYFASPTPGVVSTLKTIKQHKWPKLARQNAKVKSELF